jgi:hypothetical protein
MGDRNRQAHPPSGCTGLGFSGVTRESAWLVRAVVLARSTRRFSCGAMLSRWGFAKPVEQTWNSGQPHTIQRRSKAWLLPYEDLR